MFNPSLLWEETIASERSQPASDIIHSSPQVPARPSFSIGLQQALVIKNQQGELLFVSPYFWAVHFIGAKSLFIPSFLHLPGHFEYSEPTLV